MRGVFVPIAAWLLLAAAARAQGAPPPPPAEAPAPLSRPASAAQPAPDAPPTEDGDAGNELVLEMRLGNLILSDGIIAYQKGARLLVPLGQVAAALDFAITADPASGIAEGWFLAENRKFRLDAARREASAAGRTSRLPPDAVEVGADDIYVDAALLADWFPISAKVSLSELVLEVSAKEPLPVQERLKREGRRSRLGTNAEEPANLPVLVTPYAPLSWPFIDTSLFVGKDSRIDGGQYNYTAFLTGDLAYLNARIAVSGNQSKPFSTVRTSAGREDPRGNLLGPLRATEFEIGDVFAPQTPLVTGQIEGRGILLSNQPLDRPTEFDKTTLRGDLPLGWDVELYRNDALLDTRSSADGRYEFADVPLLYGTNTLRLVFYGPQGQRREEVRRLEVGASMLRPGERRYRIALNQQDTPTIEGGSPRRFGDPEVPGEGRFTAEYELGVTRRLSISAGFASLGLKAGRRDYVMAGARTSLLGAFIALDGAIDNDRRSAARALVQTGLGAVTLSGEHAQFFDGFVSDRTELSSRPLTRRSAARLDGSLNVPALPRLSYSVTGKLDRYNDGVSQLTLDERVSAFVKGVSASNTLSFQRFSGGGVPASETLRGVTLLSARFGEAALRGDIGYDLRPEARLSTTALTFDYGWGENTLARAALSHDFAGADRSTIALGLFKTFKHVSFGAAGTYSDDGEYSFGLSASFGLGREPREGSFAMKPRGVAASGAVSALVFLDRDLDGRFGPGDEALPGVRFQGRDRAATDARGVAFIQGVSAGRMEALSIDPASLEDPYWAPAGEGVAVLGRAGRVARVEMPVTATGEVAGKVYLLQGGRRQEIASVELELVDEAGRSAGKAKSAFDGYYAFARVRPGRYQLRVSPEQAERLKFNAPPGQPILIGPAGGPVDAPDILLSRGPQIASAPAGVSGALTSGDVPSNGPAPPAPLPLRVAAPKALAERTPAPPRANLTGRARIQLGAYTDEARAKAASTKLENAVDELFVGLRFEVQSVRASAPAGAIYRVQAGPFADLDAARSACLKLRARGQSCIPVPG